MSRHLHPFAICLFVLAFTACVKESPESTVDPLPFPSYKDTSVDPGDNFYDYCNGAWLKSHPIPETGAIGGFFDVDKMMTQRVNELKETVPDIGHFYELYNDPFGRPEETRAFIDSQKARYAKPTTKEEAFLLMGKMLIEGIAPWDSDLPKWTLQWKDRKLVGLLTPPKLPYVPSDINPEELVPLSSTKADASSALRLVIKGMGLDPSLFATTPAIAAAWEQLENSSLEALRLGFDGVWESYEMFMDRGYLEQYGIPADYLLKDIRMSLNYTLSYHIANRYVSAADKEKYLQIARDIQASFRKRIQAVEWMSETTRNNALDKLDECRLHVAYPDQWHMDCVSSLTDCESIAEAEYRNHQGVARLKAKLLGSSDGFSETIISYSVKGLDYTFHDLSVANSYYSPADNSIMIFPAILLPPFIPENSSDACAYAVYSIIGHEFTHGFDAAGAKYDKNGNIRNWWTVADQMAFEERQKNLVQCYNHLEIDPARMPGVYCDGNLTLSENIADLGGFLTALDAYSSRLQQDGYRGQSYDDQLRKFFEYYAHIWCSQLSDEHLKYFTEVDTHANTRLRVNGVVMNTDLWYQLYDVDRNNYLYLPPERRAYIW